MKPAAHSSLSAVWMLSKASFTSAGIKTDQRILADFGAVDRFGLDLVDGALAALFFLVRFRRKSAEKCLPKAALRKRQKCFGFFIT